MLQNCVEPSAGLLETASGERAPAVHPGPSWERVLPVLECESLQLRELRKEDAGDLAASLRSPEVYRHIAPPPATEAQFAQFIAWTRKARSQGRQACFGIIPRGNGAPVGFFQIWRLDPRSGVAEWGFVLDPAFWGTGTFAAAAQLVAGFAFDTLNVHRIEGRASIENGRGNGALLKLGATPEAILRQCFELGGQRVDHVMWALLADEWREARR